MKTTKKTRKVARVSHAISLIEARRSKDFLSFALNRVERELSTFIMRSKGRVTGPEHLQMELTVEYEVEEEVDDAESPVVG